MVGDMQRYSPLLDMEPLQHLNPARFETPALLKKLNAASRQLAELKGISSTIPNQAILINTLSIQEAKDSSEIENIVTTHDEVFQDDLSPLSSLSPAAKEVLRYREALWIGYRKVRQSELLTNNIIQQIRASLEQSNAGFRKVPGTTLKNDHGDIIYTPPQDQREIDSLMADLEKFINSPELSALDPLIKIALIHHRFESIHPFYDGNGRTGRLINVLYLVKEKLLDIPVLYLSRHILATKTDYYRLLEAVRNDDAWEEWVAYILTAIEHTATQAIQSITQIKAAFQDYKHRIRNEHKFYSQDLINNLFTHPYTKIEFLQNDLKVSRVTATRYLDELCASGFLIKEKISRTNYYINPTLTAILTGKPLP